MVLRSSWYRGQSKFCQGTVKRWKIIQLWFCGLAGWASRESPVEGRRRVEGKRNNGGVRRGESECHARLRKNMEYVVYSRCTNVQKERLKKDKVDVSSQTLPNIWL